MAAGREYTLGSPLYLPRYFTLVLLLLVLTLKSEWAQRVKESDGLIKKVKS